MYIFITLISFRVMWIVSGMYAYLLFPDRVTKCDIIENKELKTNIKGIYIYILNNL